MEVTEVRLNLINSDNAVKAIGSIALDGAFAIRGVRVMEDKNGHNFVAFPSRVKADGSYEDLAFPLNKDLYQHITGAIIDNYKSQVEKQEQDLNQAQTPLQGHVPQESANDTKSAPKRNKAR